MLSGPKNQNRPESGVYLIGTPAPFWSEVFQSMRTAKRLLLRQTTFGSAQRDAVAGRGRRDVTFEIPFGAAGAAGQALATGSREVSPVALHLIASVSVMAGAAAPPLWKYGLPSL